MDGKRILTASRGSVLLETAIAMPIIVALAYYLLLTTIGAVSNTTFAAYGCIAENFVLNELACVRASDIAADGTLTLPTFSQTGGYVAAPTTVEGVPIFGPDSRYTATVTTKRDAISSVASSTQASINTVYEYTITVTFRYPSAAGPTKTFSKTGTVTLVAEG
jgi:hypothetical protein